ncbi:hypothetical protein LCGC14_1632720 [marine sediment metagenome]|uniref:Uncharacterized protein n=1 Tax=marine sediment metagenome TaxID=412755 RepID=A0A0F9IPD4_9ZZZZ
MPFVPPEILKDPLTGALAEVVEDRGQYLSRHGELCDVALVKIFHACGHYKVGDQVIWLVPVEDL